MPSNPDQNKNPRRRKREFRVIPGASPGTLNIDPHARFPELYMIAYGQGEVLEKAIARPAEMRQVLGRYPVIWLNIEGLGDEKTVLDLGEIFQIHPLILEDIIHNHQQPKAEVHDSKLFFVTHMFSFKECLESEQVSFLLEKGLVLTFQERPGDCFEPVRQRIRSGKGQIRRSGADYLAYALLDAIVDSYFPLLEGYGETMDQLEDQIFTRPAPSLLDKIHQFKRDFHVMRRVIWPTREMVYFLSREEIPLIQKETRLFLRDCYDHAIQIMDMVETFREIGADVSNLYLSSLSNKLNEIMKVLTIIATIFIPLSFIAGVYGMNFNTERSPWSMPELNWYWGYPFSLAVMGVVALGLVWYFWRKGWLRNSK